MMTGLSKARDERQTRQRGIFSSLFDDFINDRFFSSFENPIMNHRYSIPAANISELDNYYLIRLAAPGLKKDDFNISLENDMLYISAELSTQNNENADNERMTRQEYNYRSFSRSFTLPKDIDRENIDATYEDGILTLKVKKDEKTIEMKKAKQIEIK